MRVLVLGAEGQLGRDVVRTCDRAGDAVTALTHRALDITDEAAVRAAASNITPDVIINCAAWTAVDACEADPARADLINGTSLRWIADAAQQTGAHLVHLSTDYVFSGRLDRAYTETDTTGPINAYGRSKLLGEREALSTMPECTVVRTSWVCGEHGANMVHTVLRLAAGSGPLRFVNDQRGCPTFTVDLAPLLRSLALQRIPGVVHATNSGPVSWFGFARAILAAAGDDPDRVEPISTADLQPARPAARPANSVLDNAVLRNLGFDQLRHFEEPLGELVRKLIGR